VIGMRHGRWVAVLGLVAALGLDAGCRARGGPLGARREVIDSTGTHVFLPTSVKRVISLAPSSTEILFALGARELVVGLDRYSDWPPETRGVERVGANIDPSLERIVGLKPDLVFTATTANTQRTAETLRGLGIAVYTSRSERLDDIYRDIDAIGDAIGRGEAARALNASLRTRMAAVRARVAGRPAVSTAVVVWSAPLVVAGPGNHVGELVQAAGGRNAIDDAKQPFPSYSLERLVARAPEVLIFGSHGDHAPQLEPIERLTTLPAVKNKRLYSVDGDLLFRPGPRVVEAAESLVRLLHPELDADGGAR
jgi:iron complex transport system substrate-binding protein